ncbi:hypothetical protein BZA70DRAFT_149939 [Myxozyma melibiosi]|uniref:TLC domain-containing protein n=1 Tax=Myxozyma melibiosi TaxID=54550 RepID=A0ABR1F808_9ASCO
MTEDTNTNTNTLRPPTTRSRTSSVGQFTLGDMGPGLSTMAATEAQIRGSKKRQRALSKGSIGGQEGEVVPGAEGEAVEKIGVGSWAWMRFRETCYQKTWVAPLILLLIPLIAFGLSSDKSDANWLYGMIFASYKLEPEYEGGPPMYGKGRNDFLFVAYYTVVLSFIREFTMQQVLEPLARWNGLKKEAKVKRFMEQTYFILYDGVMGPWGLYIMHHMPLWYFETRPLYEVPHRTHELDFKMYYLLQAAFWTQQAIVLMLQLEKPRKDFKELVLHHIVTIALIFCSYRFHFTWIGIEVYITMDVSDLALATSKTLNYLNHWLTAPFFIVFMGVWIYMRHYLSLKILWSVATEFRTVGDFVLNWETQQYKCWISQYITFALLFALQLLNLYWLFLVFRIAFRLVFNDTLKDERSDDDDDDEEEEEKKKPEPAKSAEEKKTE